MTVGEALDQIAFWLDESGDWFEPNERALALNRATSEWIEERYQLAESTEKIRAELGRLVPPPIAGTGQRMALSAQDDVWFILSLDVLWRDGEGGWTLPVACRPMSYDQVSTAKRSVFWSPTNRYPVYTRRMQNASELLEVTTQTTPDKLILHYIRRPKYVSHLATDVEWVEAPQWAQENLIQRAVRMLQAQRQQSYAAQVQIEAKPSND